MFVKLDTGWGHSTGRSDDIGNKKTKFMVLLTL